MISAILKLFGFIAKKHQDKTEVSQATVQTTDTDTQKISFDEQLNVFESLGYKLNPGINKDFIFSTILQQDRTIQNAETIFTEEPFQRLYYYLGWRGGPTPENYNYTDQCIWFDIEFIDPSSQYIWFMQRMGVISGGELKFTDMKIVVDKDKFEWLEFNVNGVAKKWKLARVNEIADSFFQRFSYLPKEFNTKGKYTYYDDGGQQFVIDYATPEEQAAFIAKTGLKREWLGEVAHFNEPID